MSTPEKHIPVINLIHFWAEKLTGSGYLLSPSTEQLIKDTVWHLKRLKEIDDGKTTGSTEASSEGKDSSCE